MKERMVIANWYGPDEKHPAEEGATVLVTVSGKIGNTTYDHAFAFGEWYEDDGWYVDGCKNGLKIEAWCDIEPYGAREAMKRYGLK